MSKVPGKVLEPKKPELVCDHPYKAGQGDPEGSLMEDRDPEEREAKQEKFRWQAEDRQRNLLRAVPPL
jgi:hypothetical protein